MFLYSKPMLTKAMNYTEIINEGLVFVTVYFMMFFTNWMQDVELRYELGFRLIYCIIFIVALNIVIIATCMCVDVYWKCKKMKHDRAWKAYNKKKE